MKKPFILSEESADKQVDMFCEYYDIDRSECAESQAEAVETSIKKISKAIRRGTVEISLNDDEDIIVTQTIPLKDESETKIVYGALSGKNKKAMSKQEDYGKIYALLGSLSGLGDTAISKLKGAHLSVAECIGMLFLQV